MFATLPLLTPRLARPALRCTQCDHVYVGKPWELPTALGCCYFRARDLGELDDEENGAELRQLVAARQAMLVVDGSTASLLDAVGDAWEVVSEVEADLLLLSFAAAATLGPTDRAEALMMTDTSERLEHARRGLYEQQLLLRDLLLPLDSSH